MKKKTHKFDFIEMTRVRSMCGVTEMNIVMNDEVQCSFGVTGKMGVKKVRIVLNWFGLMKLVTHERMTKTVY